MTGAYPAPSRSDIAKFYAQTGLETVILLISASQVTWGDRRKLLVEMGDGSHKLFPPGWPQITILLISASQVARIIRMNNQWLAFFLLLLLLGCFFVLFFLFIYF
jgi:uncharacterized RmlC-like cupin family protein